MEQLKTEGKIRAIRTSIKGPNVTQHTADLCRQYVYTGKVDVLQLVYSIFRQSNAQIFEQARQAGVGIIARTVLESGFLTGKYNSQSLFLEGDHRRRWSAEQLQEFKEATGRIEAIHQASVRNDRSFGYQILSGFIRNNDAGTRHPDT